MAAEFMERLQKMRDIYHRYHNLNYAERARENGYSGSWDSTSPIDVVGKMPSLGIEPGVCLGMPSVW